MGNRAAKVSEDSKRNDDEDDVSTKEEKQIVIADSREDQEVRAGCVYVLAFVRCFDISQTYYDAQVRYGKFYKRPIRFGR